MFEVSFVIIGIVLALAIAEWWEDRERANRTNDLVARLYIEAGENLERTKKAHRHHEMQLEVIQTHTEGKTDLTDADYRAVSQQLFSKGVFKQAQITEFNWELAKHTGLMTYMELDILNAFAEVSELRTTHTKLWDRTMEGWAAADFQDLSDKRNVELVKSAFTAIWWIEKNLIDRLEKLIAAKKPAS